MAEERIRFIAEADDTSVEKAMDNIITNVQRGEDAFQDLAASTTTSMNVASNAVQVTTSEIKEQDLVVKKLQRELVRLKSEFARLKSAGRDTSDVSNRMRKLQVELQGARLQAVDLKDQFDKNNVAIGQFGASVEQSTGRIQLNSRAAANLGFQLQDVFVQLGSGQGIIRTLIQQGPQITSIFGGFGNTMKALRQFTADSFKELVRFRRGSGNARRGLKGLGFAAAALIAIPLGTYFAKTGDLANRFERFISGISTAVFEAVERISALGGAIARLFSGGSFSDFAAEGTRALAGFGGALQEANERGVEATRRLQDIKKAANELELQNISLLGVADRARKLAEDENETVNERIRLLNQATSIEQTVRRERIATLQQILQAQKDRNDSAEEQFGTQKEIAELEQELATATIENQTEINELVQERIDKTRELATVLAEAAGRLGDPIQQAQAKARIELERSLQAIKDLEEEARKIGFEGSFGDLEIVARAEFERAVDAARGELDKIPTQLDAVGRKLAGDKTIPFAVNQMGDDIVARLKSYETDFTKVGIEYNEALAKGVELNESPLDAITATLQKVFDLTEAEFDFLIQSIGFSLSALSDGLAADIDRQIMEQERLIQSFEDNISSIQQNIAEEEKKASEGRANNLGLYKKQLDEQVKAQQEAEQRRLELEKKAARQRLIINSAERASNLVLAAAKLAAAEAGKGLIGIGLAIAGLALLKSIVSQANAIATQFESPGFAEGEPFILGPGSTKSDSIAARLSYGERVLDAKNNKKIGGASTSNSDLVNYFSLGKTISEHPQMLMPDFTDFLRLALNDQNKVAQMNFIHHTEMLAKSQEAAIEESTNKMIDYWRSRPIEYYDFDGNKVVERVDGGVIKRQRIKTVN